MSIIDARVIQKIGTESEWNANELILLKGEIALVGQGDRVVNIKVGNGAKKFRELPYLYTGGFTDSVTPTTQGSALVDGMYIANGAGTYTNMGGLVVKENYFTIISKVGTDYAVASEVKLPTISIDGRVEENNEDAVQGGEIYNSLQPYESVIIRKNLFNKENNLIQGVMLASGGAIPADQVRMTQTTSVDSWKIIQPIKLHKGWYTIQFNGTINSNPNYAGLFTTNEIGNNIFGKKITSKTFEVTDEVAYFILNASNGTTDLDLNVIQLERGKVATDYVNYNDVFLDADKLTTASKYIENDSSMEILIKENNILVRTYYDDNQDLVHNYQYNQATNTNGNFSPYQTYLIAKGVALESDLTAYLHHNTNDSISALGNAPYWFILGQHGYLIPRATASGNVFTEGQQVKDSRGAEYKVIYKTGNFVFLEPKITVVGNTITRSWNNGDTFTTLSNLDGTNQVNVTAVSNYQVKPMLNKNKQEIYIDGVKVDGLGKFKGSDVKLQDIFSAVNPIGASYNLSGVRPAMSGNDLIEVTQSYYFKGKSVYSSTNLNMKDWLPIDKYHGLQPLGLMPMGDFKPYISYPKVKPKSLTGRTDVDWNYPTDVSSTNTTQYAQYTYENKSTDIENVNDMPDRTIQFHKDSTNNFGIGFASGLDLETGLTAKGKWHNYSDQAFGFSQGTSTSNKTYFRALRGVKFDNGILPTSFIGQINGYFAYYQPKSNIQSYVVHTEDTSYIYIHTQQLFSKELVVVDNINGKQLEIVEVKNIELLTDRVNDNKIFIKSSTNEASYIVLKTK